MEEDENPIEQPPIEQPPVDQPPVEQPAPEPNPLEAQLATEREQRTAVERERDELRTERDRIATEARTERIASIATRLNFNDPADAERFLASDVTDIEAALTEVLTAKPYLAKQEVVTPPVTPTSPTNPARGETLTLEAIKAMTPEQIASRWVEVNAALAVK